jgi:hypothetical protein
MWSFLQIFHVEKHNGINFINGLWFENEFSLRETIYRDILIENPYVKEKALVKKKLLDTFIISPHFSDNWFLDASVFKLFNTDTIF